jgi:hypothetical protein
VYESVLELLKDLQIDGEGATDSRTLALVQGLCRKFERLEIAEIIKSIDQDTKRTILTAIINAREFRLANLTASDRAIPVADLADHLSRMMDLIDPDPETTPHDHGVKHTLSAVRYSGLVPTNDECTVILTTDKTGLDFPALSPIVDGSLSSSSVPLPNWYDSP